MQIYSPQKIVHHHGAHQGHEGSKNLYSKLRSLRELRGDNCLLFFWIAALPRWVSIVKFVFSTVVLARGAGPSRRAERRPKD